ncbi:MAG: TlpA family protein disulfide reductase [Deltaproteobacteria bacterium]|nr:TlpA family protein disulfide reductase [Deltaproteobacteria bacterium]
MKKILVMILLVFVFAGCNKGKDEKASPYRQDLKPGSPSVDFLYKDMDEKPFRLSEEKGKVVVLYFWRMKCSECKDEMKSLESLYRKYKDRGIKVVAVGADTMHSAPIEDVREFLSKSGITFTNLRDDQGFVSEAYNVLKAPEAFVIDKNGIIDVVMMTNTDWMSDESIKLFESLLK